jgi:triosephosphate isomerase
MANWKMHKDLEQARAFAPALLEALGDVRLTTEAETSEPSARVAICPPAPFLLPLAEAFEASPVAVGAQHCHPEPEGAYTGAMSSEMAASVGASLQLCGHSERRRIFGDSSEDVNSELKAAIGTGLTPVLCVGETQAEREADRTFAVLSQQLVVGLFGINIREIQQLVVAYEPVWAIGTGLTATAEQAQQAHRFIRDTIAQRFSEELASRTPVLYGGSVKPKNAREIMAQQDIDGVLVGGASLDPESFAAIIHAALPAQTVA